MADDYQIGRVGADDYWIEKVGGHRHHHRRRSYGDYGPLFYTLVVDDDGRIRKSTDDDTEDDKGSRVAGVPANVAAAQERVQNGRGSSADIQLVASFNANYMRKHPNETFYKHESLLDDVVHLANQVTKLPIVGPLIHATLKLNPVTALGGLIGHIAAGERIDQAFLNSAKGQIQAAREIAPYVQTVLSFVPGVGTGVSAAIAAGTALAEGRTISDAVLNGIKGALPGGPLAKAAFDASVNIASGQNITDVGLNAAMAQLPSEAQQAVKAAIAIAKGQNVKDVALRALRANIPAAAQKALDVGTALATGRNIQSAAVAALGMAPIGPILAVGQKAVASNAAWQAIAKGMQGPGAEGFKLALGVLAHRGVTPHGLVKLRERLGPIQRAGFDHGLRVIHEKNYQNASLVKNGVVLRGKWHPVTATAKGAIHGRMVQGSKVTLGHFARV